MVTINQPIDEQQHDPSARLTLSEENLTFIRLLQRTKHFFEERVIDLLLQKL